ncbi:MAG: hypothetical protein NTU69_09935 [Proteobacteria bacterium]|nr:hypothetical protein [Pseudomonadota bacterium]
MKKQIKKEDLENTPLSIKAEMALKEAVAEAIAEHKKRGNPISVLRDGKVVWVPAEEIVVPKFKQQKEKDFEAA